MNPPTPSPPIGPWPRHGSRPGEDLRIFRVRHDELENPRNGHRMTATVLESAPWVNVIARTAQGELALVRQWRFGIGELTVELPGGLVDPGESPRQAAERELLEETGFVAERWTDLGASEPNPAFLDNLCHHFLADGIVHQDRASAETAADAAHDAGEHIERLLWPWERVLGAIHAGEIRHTLVLTALAKLYDLRRPQPDLDS